MTSATVILPIANAELRAFASHAELQAYLKAHPRVQFLCKCQRQKSCKGEIHALLVTHASTEDAAIARVDDEVLQNEAKKSYNRQMNLNRCV